MSSQPKSAPPKRDHERLERIQRALKEAQIDALVCALPAYVLMCSGYWPVIGASLAVVTAEGRAVVLSPKDEQELAKRGWADEVRTFQPASLSEIRSTADAARLALQQLAQDLDMRCMRIGYELGPASEPASYAAMHLYGGTIVQILREAVPTAPLAPADDVLARLAAVKTRHEVACVRTACDIAAEAFASGCRHLRPGLKETDAAAFFRAPLSTQGVDRNNVARADGFTFCMSGPNSAEASGAYARSRARAVRASEFVLLHCNSYADGYWTDITRTYTLLAAEERQRMIYEAVLEARRAALDAIRPGAHASEVDRAARDVLRGRGFEKEFKHSTGHGVGFSAIAHDALPHIHPKSDEVLEAGMVFNVEPAVYIEGWGGMRHCDVVAVGPSGVELLTPFQASLEELVLTM